MLNRRDERFYELIGQRVRERREGRLTQEQLATMIGVKRTSITNFESGKQHMPLHLLLRLADGLDCEMKELLPARAELHEQDSDSFEVVSPPLADISAKTSAVIREFTSPSENPNEHDR